MSTPAPTLLEAQEPQFARHWLQHNSTDDPQHARWADLEAQQLSEGRERVRQIASEHFAVAGRRVLDLGAQWGAMCVALHDAGATAVGIDISDDYVAGAQIRAREQGADAEFVKGVGEALPFPAASFDAVICVNVIEHVVNHGATIREIVRVLRPGGDLFLDGPNRLSPHNLMSDPHYQMRGISVLPPRIGRFYVTRVRRYPSYDVGTFPLAGMIVRQLLQAGLAVIGSSRRPAGRLSSVRFNVTRMFWVHARKP